MARKTEELVVADVDVELTAANLFAANVPVMYYPAKGETGIQYHINIQFADFADMKRRAIEKVKHAVGHAIRDKKINSDGHEAGITTVDSTGYPPKSAIDKVADFTAAVKATKDATEKKELAKLLQALLKDLK
jgi:hypothetical protein